MTAPAVLYAPLFLGTVAKDTTVLITNAVVRDENGTPLPAATLTTLVVTGYDQRTGAIINGRDHQSVLNVNGGTVDSGGNLTLLLTLLDTVMTNAPLGTERHIYLFEWTWSAGSKAGKQEVQVDVTQLVKAL